MAKISKRVLDKHNEAVALLDKGDIDFNDREFIYTHYHEGAGKMNNLISAHFTPRVLGNAMAHNVRQHNWVDIGSGIGMLSYANMRFNQWPIKPFLGICVENCTEYYEIGRKLLPEMVWINGSIFDDEVIAEIKLIMNGENFSILSNPPYGNQVKGKHREMRYTGSKFEYKAIEMGAILGAYDGAFLIPQQSVPFRMTGNHEYGVHHESYKTKDYNKFIEQTGLEISTNIGFTTEILDDSEPGWKDVSIVTEIAILEYDELDYNPKRKAKPMAPTPEQINNQMKLF